jgi:serine/threonine-protein kinase haspin
LVRYDAPSDASSSAVRAKRTRSGSISMDDPSHGVQVTIIDLGFARMDTGDVKGVRALWTQPDEEMFEGEGAAG